MPLSYVRYFGLSFALGVTILARERWSFDPRQYWQAVPQQSIRRGRTHPWHPWHSESLVQRRHADTAAWHSPAVPEPASMAYDATWEHCGLVTAFGSASWYGRANHRLAGRMSNTSSMLRRIFASYTPYAVRCMLRCMDCFGADWSTKRTYGSASPSTHRSCVHAALPAAGTRHAPTDAQVRGCACMRLPPMPAWPCRPPGTSVLRRGVRH